MSDKCYQKVRERFLTGSASGHAAFDRASSSFSTINFVKTMPKRNGDSGDTEVVLDAPGRATEPER